MDGIRMRIYYSGSASENIYPNPDPRLTKDFRPKGIRIMYCRILLGSNHSKHNKDVNCH